MKIKTSELTGAALDWAVAKCEGVSFVHGDCEYELDGRVFQRGGCSVERRYSTDWAQGGPIIERKEIGISRNAPCSKGREWEARPSITAKGAGGRWGYGPTPLIAAMRCHVASELGDEVDVPEELK
jgi:hypothetical protein